MQAILGNFLAPGLADRYLAANAVEGQLTEEREIPGRPDNLYHPVDGLHRTRGRFGLPRHDLRLAAPSGTARGLAVAAGLILAGGLGLAMSRMTPRLR